MTPEPDLQPFLQPSEMIDFQHPEVVRVASRFATGDDCETARRCFDFVRDEIRHSSDFQTNPVTCRASDVLRYGTGYCYAKSHLLCALLRCNRIPAGLCYQRLVIDADAPTCCLHGLNAVYLNDFGWYRVDARGNRQGIDSQFDPPRERLAFTNDDEGEFLFSKIYDLPLPEVVNC
ncbi:MAG: transglutaminase family protein, partial [Planctomycetales bacterium]|nr:transglutaminase family protein [Planctomycetales bacterium]